MYLENCAKYYRISPDSILSMAEISSMPNWLHTLQHLQTITDYVTINKKVIYEASKVLLVLNTTKSTGRALQKPEAKEEGARREQAGRTTVFSTQTLSYQMA